MKPTLNVLSCLWACLTILAAAPAARANTEIPIAGIFDGATPYLVVSEDAEGGSARAPGIYIADSRGKWLPLVEGQVIAGGSCKGILAQLELTKVDQRYEAISAVNGKLLLLQYNAKGGPVASNYIVLGETEGAELQDVHGNQIALPPVEKVENVSVWAGPVSDEGQTVLVSVRSAAPGPMGDGVTFGFFVRRASIENGGMLALSAPPTVLDYGFQSYEQLARLMPAPLKNSKGVLSKLLLTTHSRKRAGDVGSYQAWKAELSQLAEWLGKPPSAGQGAPDIDYNSVPFVDALTGTVRIVQGPSSAQRMGTITVAQVYDPIAGHDEVHFKLNGQSASIHGRLDTWATARANSPFLVASDSVRRDAGVAYVNRQPVLGLVYNNAMTVMPIDKKVAELPTQLSVVSKSIAAPGQPVQHYLLVSRVMRGMESTQAYILTQSPSGAFSLSHHFEVSDQFHEEWDLRLRSTNELFEKANHQVLFDNITPTQPNPEAYQQLRKMTTPQLNLTLMKDKDGDIVQSYVQPLESKDLHGSIGAYRVFDLQGALSNQSGLSIWNRDGTVKHQLPGNALTLPGANPNVVELMVKEVKLLETGVPARVSVFAMDMGFNHGKSSFMLLTLLSYAGKADDDAYFPPVFLHSAMDLPFDRLESVQVLAGNPKNGVEHFQAICSFGPSAAGVADARHPNGVVYSVNHLITKNAVFDAAGKPAPPTFNLAKAEISRLVTEHVAPDMISERIKVDSDGKTYWVVSPELGEADPQYMLKNLANGQLIQPNTHAGRGTKLLDDKDAKRVLYGEGDGGGWGNFFGGPKNPWSFTGQMTFEDRTGLNAEQIKSYQPYAASFPDLLGELEALADPANPPKHVIFLVSDKMEGELWAGMAYLAVGEKPTGKKSTLFAPFLKNLDLATFDQKRSSQSDVIESLTTMREAKQGTRSMLIGYGNMAQTFAMPATKQEEGNQGMTLVDPSLPPEQRAPVPPHLMYLLATEGLNVSLDAIKNGKLPAPRVSMAITMTPKQLRVAREQMGSFDQYGILESFEINRRFYMGNWKLFDPRSSKASPEVIKHSKQPVSELEREVFPNLTRSLDELSDPSRPAKHRLLVVSKELKPLVMRLILSRWASERGQGDRWNFSNPKLELYQFHANQLDQDSIRQNFSALSNGGDGRRGVLLASVDELNKASRPQQADGQKPFLIDDFVDGAAGANVADDAAADAANAGQLPHALYWFATEGKDVSPEDFVKERQAFESGFQVSELLIGTQEEVDILMRDTAFEARFDLGSRFETFELQAPNTQTKTDLLVRVARSPEINRLGYQYDTKGLGLKNQVLSGYEAMEKLLSYLVNRCETLAIQFKQEVTASYIRVLSAFRRALIEDPELRSSRVIDRGYVERLLTRIFSIPLNLNILPPNDPLIQLSHERAPLRLQEAGYRGPLELKAQVIRTLLAPTRNDPVRPIPSSIILLGDSSTGKTFLFRKVMSMLGLKEYNYNSTNNEDAGYIVVQVGKLTAQVTNSPETLSVDEALQHVSNFLAQPNGFRGHILFDDAHKAEDDVIHKIITFQQSLFESEKGMVRVVSGLPDSKWREAALQQEGQKRKDRPAPGANGGPAPAGEIREIPVRNLNLWMTLNPTADLKKLERFHGKGTDVDAIVATLSTEKHPVEASFVMRWGLTLNVNKFPMDAKAPALADSLRNNAQNDYNVQGRLILVAPQAVNLVVGKFADTNAREFLSTATSQLLQGPTESGEQGSLFVVVPTSQAGALNPNGRNRPALPASWEGTGRSNTDIENYIRASTVAIPVEGRADGKLHLLSIMVDSFRTQVLESFIDSSTQDERFAGGPKQLRNVLAPVLHGMTATLLQKPFIPLKLLNLDPNDFVTTRTQVRDFINTIEASGPGSSSFFDVRIPDELDAAERLKAFFSSSTSEYKDRHRARVMTEYSAKIEQVLQKYLQVTMRVQSTLQLPSPDAWLKGLAATEPSVEIDGLAKALGDLYFDFWTEINDPSLVESRSMGQFKTLNTYDVARLFLMAMDRGITKLPWGKIVQLASRGLALTASDLEIGQRPGVQAYFFSSKHSLFKPATHEFALQMATGSQAYKEWSKDLATKLDQEWKENCWSIFEPVKQPVMAPSGEGNGS